MFSLLSPPKLAFEPVDPLGDGLGDDIAAQQSNPEVLAFQEDLDADNLVAFWSEVERDVRSDPDWYSGSE